ncbi:MAG: CDP-glucose 4,6-dehydratase [Betaproteobacteria bacterium]|nr:CDP-glucose 4,6-dehydratase [Betaproteobacteria bacterium]
MNPAFWQGKRVFITGHTGFKGSWLCLWLHTLGAKVTGFALPAVQQSLFNQANVAASMNSLTGDVRDLLAFKTAMAATEPEIVIHMAAQALVRESYKDPVNTYTTNVLGTVNLFEAIKSTPSVRAVVNVTTDKCYDKACSELVAASYRQSFFSAQHFDQHGVAIATARAGNVIGGGDYAMDRLIPDIVSSFASGKTVNIRYPQAIRPWQHVLEPLNGYLMLAQALFERGPEFAEPWNFGPHLEDAQTVEWIVQHMAELWAAQTGAQPAWQVEGGQHLHEAHTLRLDTSKAQSLLNWKPKLNIETVLDWVTQWYQGANQGQSARELTFKQIQSYQNLT